MPSHSFFVLFSVCILPLGSSPSACRDTLPRDTLPRDAYSGLDFASILQGLILFACDAFNKGPETVQTWGDCNQGLHARLLTYFTEALQ